jgi:hypothetical protein
VTMTMESGPGVEGGLDTKAHEEVDRTASVTNDIPQPRQPEGPPGTRQTIAFPAYVCPIWVGVCVGLAGVGSRSSLPGTRLTFQAVGLGSADSIRRSVRLEGQKMQIYQQGRPVE